MCAPKLLLSYERTNTLNTVHARDRRSIHQFSGRTEYAHGGGDGEEREKAGGNVVVQADHDAVEPVGLLKVQVAFHEAHDGLHCWLLNVLNNRLLCACCSQLLVRV